MLQGEAFVLLTQADNSNSRKSMRKLNNRVKKETGQNAL